MHYFVCRAELQDGACPPEAQAWVSSAEIDPFAPPSQEQLSAAFEAAMTAFFVPTMIILLIAIFIRWIVEEVR
tara:strand:+ start:108 stop:326 length:219 start_codon:yes stop_codon:yes gene_type:complete